MSEIVSIANNNKIIIAADSMVSGYENDLYLGTTALNSKVKFHPILNCYIGTVGSTNMSLAIEQFIAENPEITDSEKLINQITDLSNYVLEFESLIQKNHIEDEKSIGQIYIYAYTNLDFDSNSNNNLIESDFSFRSFGVFVKNDPLIFKPYSTTERKINYQLGQRLTCHGGELKDKISLELDRFSDNLTQTDAEDILINLLKYNKSLGKVIETKDVIGGPVIIYTLEIVDSKLIASQYVIENVFGDSEIIYSQIKNNRINVFPSICKVISSVVSKNDFLNIENSKLKDEVLMLRIDNNELISISKELYKRLKTPFILRVFYKTKALCKQKLRSLFYKKKVAVSKNY